ncbi:Hypothetical_protein [Hexamita inflata]|uniref:Hypothetical_protein n=1 Tax=Hexamita inflata TaxID=28002 RepID=A0AA86QTE2_9EUKA|nr:Hypothetical protein HINF_LOCUS53346 [Hexamita inflata]
MKYVRSELLSHGNTTRQTWLSADIEVCIFASKSRQKHNSTTSHAFSVSELIARPRENHCNGAVTVTGVRHLEVKVCYVDLLTARCMRTGILDHYFFTIAT